MPQIEFEACHEMSQAQILNEQKSQYPLYKVVLYGDRVSTAKFSKRVSCAIKHLPIRVQFFFEPDTQKAIEAGIAKDPTLTLDGEIFIEGLIQAEKITKRFEDIIGA